MAIKWYHQVAAFFAGAFFFNCLPHLLQGISGNAFPTPFADPPGQGLSSPTLNVCWGFANLALGYLLYRVAKIGYGNKWGLVIFLIAGLIMSLMLSENFSHKATV